MAVDLSYPSRHVVVITIDRAPVNALDLDHLQLLAAGWRHFTADPDLRVAVVTGVGSSFCVGADLKSLIPELARLAAAGADDLVGSPFADVSHAVLADLSEPVTKPIIAAVNGDCLGGGMTLLCGTDIRLASPNATFGVTEPRRGLVAGAGTTVSLARQLPYVHAMELLLRAGRVSAAQAVASGLVNRVIDDEAGLLDAALDIATEIAAHAPLAVQATKESVVRGRLLGYDDALALEQRLTATVLASSDAAEGALAFAERRSPVWLGR